MRKTSILRLGTSPGNASSRSGPGPVRLAKPLLATNQQNGTQSSEPVLQALVQVRGVHWGEQAVARCPGEEDRQQTPAERLKANGIPVFESADRLLREICPVATCLVAVRSGVDEIDATRSGVDVRKGE